MVLDLIVHKSKTPFSVGRGGKAIKVSVIGLLEKKHRTTIDNNGIDAFSMAILIVGRTCSSVAGPFVS